MREALPTLKGGPGLSSYDLRASDLHNRTNISLVNILNE